MTIVEKLKLSLEMLGGVATLTDIYKVLKKSTKIPSRPLNLV